MKLKNLFVQAGITLLSLPFLLTNSTAQTPSAAHVSKVWVADKGDGTYKNPILHADYSDPDAIRVGDARFPGPQ